MCGLEVVSIIGSAASLWNNVIDVNIIPRADRFLANAADSTLILAQLFCEPREVRFTGWHFDLLWGGKALWMQPVDVTPTGSMP